MASSRRFRFQPQRDAMQCGVACLCMVCNALGLRCSLDDIERLCHASREGVSLKGIHDAAGELGLNAAAARLTPEQLVSCSLPAILHWEQRHFIVLYKVSGDGRRFYVADPAKGKAAYSLAELLAGWASDDGSGVAMLFEPTECFGVETGGGRGTVRRSFGFLFGYIRRYRGYFAQIMLGLLLGCLLQLVLPFLTQWIVDIGIRHRDIRFIWLVLIGELMIVAVDDDEVDRHRVVEAAKTACIQSTYPKMHNQTLSFGLSYTL